MPREPQGQVLPVRLVGGARQEAVGKAGGERAVDEEALSSEIQINFSMYVRYFE